MTEVEEAITNSIKNFEEKFRQERLDSIRKESQEDNPYLYWPDTFWCESDMKYWIEAELFKSLDRDRYAIHTEVSIDKTIFDEDKIKELRRMINRRVSRKDRVRRSLRPDLGIFPTRDGDEQDSYALMEFTFDLNSRNTPSSDSRQPKRALINALKKLEIEAISLQSAIECEITGQGWIVFTHELLYEFVSGDQEVRSSFNRIKNDCRNVKFNLIGTTFEERAGAAGR